MAKESGRDPERSGRTPQQSSSATRRSVLKAAGVGLAGAAVGGVSGVAAADETSVSRLHTDGKWIRNEEGEAVEFRGLATADPAYYERWHPKSAQEVVEWATDPARGWYPNVVRLPMTQGHIDHFGLDTVVEDILRPLVDLLRERGIYALIDYHLVRPYTEAATEDSDWHERSPDDLVRTFWNRVAPEFADDEHVVYELFNEPTYPVWWGDQGEGEELWEQEEIWLLWRDTAQPWVDLVQEHAPETPLIIGSPHWTSRTNFAPEHPFEGENLIYAAHIYPDNGQPSEFDDQYGAPAEEVPVVVTEFGWDPDGEGEYEGSTTEWGEPFRDWVEGYDNMGWISWCFDDSWAPTMFDSPGEGANEPWDLKDDPEGYGQFVKQWLAEYSEDPVAYLQPSATEATVGERLTFEVEDASGAGNWIEDLEWEFGDGAAASGWWADHRYDEPGTYTVSLTATDDEGTATAHEVPIAVSDLSDTLALARPSTTEAAVDERITFEAEDASGSDRWIAGLEWEFGDGAAASGWWADHRYDEAGTYTVTLTATGNEGHETTHEVEITVE